MSVFTCIDFSVALALSTLVLSFVLSSFCLLRNAVVKNHE